MTPDEALAHVEDATPGEDVEAWIAQILAAEMRELRRIRGTARGMITARDKKIDALEQIKRRAQELATAEGDHVRLSDRQTARWILTGEM